MSPAHMPQLGLGRRGLLGALAASAFVAATPRRALAAPGASTAAAQPVPAGAAPPGVYDALVWSHAPAAFLPLDGSRDDLSNRQHASSYSASDATGFTSLPNGDDAVTFDGASQFVEIADSADLSVTATGVLTIEAWMRPDTLDFPRSENGYVHWLGKGTSAEHEYVARMYNRASARPSRISGYAFNLGGGLGAGSYFEDDLQPGTWVHYGLVINANDSGSDGWGTVRIYRDGVLRDADSLGGGYSIVPARGSAPLRIGTRDGKSFFHGAVGKVAIYNYDASHHFRSHVQQMGHFEADPPPTAPPAETPEQPVTPPEVPPSAPEPAMPELPPAPPALPPSPAPTDKRGRRCRRRRHHQRRRPA
ncbi:MAG TPA: LamG domain-containing protein [Nocardioidaceae bacterium]|nr:LamG domain-containing protein [Nocardioidaceae bacterium]